MELPIATNDRLLALADDLFDLEAAAALRVPAADHAEEGSVPVGLERA